MKTILLVEDSPVTQRILSLILEKNGFTVISAFNGLEALEALDQISVELVLCDVGMPEMDGLTLLKRLRADEHYKFLPVIMLTASGQDEDRIAARAEGANYFLTKPSSSKELLDTVNQVLDLCTV
ncbi:MAG: response regulator [Chloroflexi bacterium]|nr:response regulator [Chloroflexota bacterium]